MNTTVVTFVFYNTNAEFFYFASKLEKIAARQYIIMMYLVYIKRIQGKKLEYQRYYKFEGHGELNHHILIIF